MFIHFLNLLFTRVSAVCNIIKTRALPLRKCAYSIFKSPINLNFLQARLQEHSVCPTDGHRMTTDPKVQHGGADGGKFGYEFLSYFSDNEFHFYCVVFTSVIYGEARVCSVLEDSLILPDAERPHASCIA